MTGIGLSKISGKKFGKEKFSPFFLLDTGKKEPKPRRPTYVPKDRRGDPLSNPESESNFLLEDPSTIKTDIQLDSSGEFFIIDEKSGELEYRPSTIMTTEEFRKLQQRKMVRSYWQNKSYSNDSTGVGGKKTDPKSLNLKFQITEEDYVDIRPNGMVTLDFGYKHQKTFNPQIARREQSQGNFDFDNQMQFNLTGVIGKKLKTGQNRDRIKMNVNWDTKATFDFQNQFKVEFIGYEEDIIQKIEVGQVSMPVNTNLISGAQNLFGVKTKMQFGRLSATSVFSTQRGKAEEIKAQGGATSRTFEIRADNYDEYRHFFLGQFFRDRYEQALSTTPIITSGVKMTPGRIAVYITNSNNTTTDLRNVVAFLDLGENASNVYNSNIIIPTIPTNAPAYDSVNHLRRYTKDPGDLYRNPISVANQLEADGLVKGTDFEVLNNARKLRNEEFTYNADLGYISLTTPLRPYEILAVAYEYSFDGKNYKVGDLNGDAVDSNATDEVIFLKLLKPASIKTNLPTWDLMMKNIYNLGSSQISREGFQFRVIYRDDISGADIPTLQEGERTKNVPLVRTFGLDRLNMNGDPYPDGNFDFVENVTIDPKFGRIIFPVLEPFGATIASQFNNNEAELKDKYNFYELYDSTKSDASQISRKNKYYFKGRFQSSSSNEIPLQGINIAPGSVKVTAGSRALTEGVDYTVDYSQGKVRILNEGILASGQEVKINYEKQDLFNVRQKSFMGTRLEYVINKDVSFGGTFLHQNERPTITRVNIGDEPSSNTLWGLDANYKRDSRLLTKLVDALPIIQTKAVSTITAQGEFAHFIPGYNKALDQNGEGGAAFIDDFESAETPFDFVRSPFRWRLAATPLRFPEASSGSLNNGYRRALLSWYNADQSLYISGQGNTNLLVENIGRNHFDRPIAVREIFPGYVDQQLQQNQTTLDLVYFPQERGPYNYNPSLGISSGNWAGITRDIRNDIDFDNANIQYLEFWMMSPYIDDTAPNLINDIDGVPFNASNRGKLFFNLGNISEDVLKDELQSSENGIPVGSDQSSVQDNTWGKIPTRTPLNNAFDNNPASRSLQDVGLDGLSNTEEASKFPAVGPAENPDDRSNDDFVYYLDGRFGDEDGLTKRYKRFSGMENNSPTDNPTASNYVQPDNEDINQDNTLSTVNEYYEYEINIDPTQFQVGQNFIVGKTTTTVPDPKQEGASETVTWYQFRIPIRNPNATIGNISGFKSIRFMRMYMTGFESPVALRFAQLQLVSNQWRAYVGDLPENSFAPSDPEIDDDPLLISTVNVEENGSISPGQPYPYVLPPGVIRDQDATSTINRQINEQSLKISVTDLDNKNAKAAFKNISELNLLNYKRLNMFIHADAPSDVKNGQLTAFLRLGTDLTQNFYEVEVPLYFSQPGNAAQNEVWREENEIDIAIEDIINVKLARNEATNNNLQASFKQKVGKYWVHVTGNPDLSTVTILMVGIRNPDINPLDPADNDRSEKSGNIWVNELRTTQFVRKSSWATMARVNAKLADLATVTASGKFTSVGFGSLDQRISQRELANTLEYGSSAAVTLDKFIPEKAGIKLPMYVSYDRKQVMPEYNPLDKDVKMDRSLENKSAEEKREYRRLVYDITTRRTISFTNFKKVKVKKDAKSHFWDIENLSFTVGYNETKRTSYELKDYTFLNYKGGVEYTYSFKAKPLEPFKKSKVKSAYFKPIKDFNLSFVPNTFTFRNDLDRRLIRTQYYESGPLTAGQEALYEKAFTLNRSYALGWGLTKNINLNYDAAALAIVDEPARAPGDQAYKDSVWSNFKNMGRLKNFEQSASLTYKLPIDKFPVFAWINNTNLKYGTSAIWASGSLIQRDTMGNLLQNKRDLSVDTKLNFEMLYNKSKFLKSINSPAPKKTALQKAEEAKKKAAAKDTTETKPDMKALKAALRTLMLIRNINLRANIAQGMSITGYMPVPTYFGVDTRGNTSQMSNSGDILPFMFGSQNTNVRFDMAENGWISKERELNAPFLANQTVGFTANTTVEPFKDFKIMVDMKKNKGWNYQELFRVSSENPDSMFYVSESPSRTGTYSLSTISILSSFGRNSETTNSNPFFDRFQSYRTIIRSRLGNTGYSNNSQDVLIPAFLAAYTGRDPQKVKLSSFPKLPLPNWSINYSGLNKIPILSKRFTSITLTHTYNSMYSIGSFSSSTLYGYDYIRPDFDIDRQFQSGQGVLNDDSLLLPVYLLEQVNIRENFGPFLGINIKTKGKLSYRIEYKRSRNLTLALSNIQMREDISNDITVGFGFAKSGTKLPFKVRGRDKILERELNVRIDFSVKDNKAYQRVLDENSIITAGNTNIQFRPTASYNVSQRLTTQFYFEHTRAIPRVSTSFKRNTTSFGLQLRFSLS
ncbi:MAG: cell surface protein SprA [Cytophagaceae bacterium]|jgi:cell surface protein SprA|nr:cell surface protein SprA [Cytophagaceae bacterium]